MKMYPLSLYETEESNGTVSLLELFNNPDSFDGCISKLDIPGLIRAICRGGWPSCFIIPDEKNKYDVAYDLVYQTCHKDISNIDKVKRNPKWAEAILKLYSRNICTLTDYKTIYNDVRISNDILDKYEMYELNVNYQKNYPINVSSSYPLDVRLYDEHMQVLINNPTNTYNSGTYSVSINQNLSVGRYYLRVVYKNTSYSGPITTQIVGHTHSYNNSYTWLNYNQHRAYCACGNSHTEHHVVFAKSFGDDVEYVTCILCGGPANAGIVPGMKGIQITESGSFISPNGILVLVDVDIDSYFVGEIVFEHEDVEITRNINIPPYIVRKDEYNEENLV